MKWHALDNKIRRILMYKREVRNEYSWNCSTYTSIQFISFTAWSFNAIIMASTKVFILFTIISIVKFAFSQGKRWIYWLYAAGVYGSAILQFPNIYSSLSLSKLSDLLTEPWVDVVTLPAVTPAPIPVNSDDVVLYDNAYNRFLSLSMVEIDALKNTGTTRKC